LYYRLNKLNEEEFKRGFKLYKEKVLNSIKYYN